MSIDVFLFRDQFVSGSLSVACAAPYAAVIKAYPAEPGVSEWAYSHELVRAAMAGPETSEVAAFFDAFGGGAVYWNNDSGSFYLGVWGSRNASRLRTGLRRVGLEINILRQAPPARLMYTCSNGRRPKSGASLV